VNYPLTTIDIHMNTKTSRIAKLPEVQHKTGLGRTSIYNKMARGEFPKSIPIGARAVGWLEADVDRWIAERIEAARRA